MLVWDKMKRPQFVIAGAVSIHFFQVSSGGVTSVRNSGVYAKREMTVYGGYLHCFKLWNEY